MAKEQKPSSATEATFIRYYERYSEAIFRHCYYRVFDRDKAKDLMQETFMKTWRELVAGADIDEMRPFLYKVATNLIIDASRKKKEASLEVMAESGVEPSNDPREAISDELEAKAVIAVIQRLEADDREVLLLRYVEGFSPKEIAAMLEETPNVISVRLHRAKIKLRALRQGSPINV